MDSRSISRELALLVLGQISETQNNNIESLSIESLLNKALQSLMDHCREGLDDSANKLQIAQQHLLDSQLHNLDKSSLEQIRNNLSSGLVEAENILNALSGVLEFPRLLALCDLEEIRISAIKRVELAFQERINIDKRLDSVMEGWRFKRLPRIDRDILRLAFIDLNYLNTPVSVTCNEAVELAHRYSDEQGRRMINGVLRRLQNSFSATLN